MTPKFSAVVLAAVPFVLFATPAHADEVEVGPGVEVGPAVEIGAANDPFLDDIVDMVSEGSALAPPSR